ncbi:magnesium transporter CorA family protein [Rheinheimera sp.]|uniref:magnesium transporter CorA family protein n=1 Tax=Rheinheimera sp. TaxID=1869214 RepID=UPI00404769B3
MILVHYYEPETQRWRQGDISLLPASIAADARVWLNLDQASADEIQQVMLRFAIAATLTDDFSRQRHPPKLETQADFTLLVMRAYADADFAQYNASAQVNLLFSKQVLISRIQCHNAELHQQLLPTLTTQQSAVVADWVKHIIATVSASYLEKLINFEDEQSELEDIMLHRGNDEQMALIMRYRSVLRKINRNLAYHKDMFAEVLYDQSQTLSQFSQTDIRDFYEKFERLHSMTDMYYDQLSDLVDGYLSTTSHQINERMKVLTMVSTIFIPLTFIAGIYGMNFIYMPELQMANGYFAVLATMLAGGIAGLLWFKMRGWW